MGERKAPWLRLQGLSRNMQQQGSPYGWNLVLDSVKSAGEALKSRCDGTRLEPAQKQWLACVLCSIEDAGLLLWCFWLQIVVAGRCMGTAADS